MQNCHHCRIFQKAIYLISFHSFTQANLSRHSGGLFYSHSLSSSATVDETGSSLYWIIQQQRMDPFLLFWFSSRYNDGFCRRMQKSVCVDILKITSRYYFLWSNTLNTLTKTSKFMFRFLANVLIPMRKLEQLFNTVLTYCFFPAQAIGDIIGVKRY